MAGALFANEGEKSGAGRRRMLLWRWLLKRRRPDWPRWREVAAVPPPSRAAAGTLSVTFIGHATFLLQLGEVAVLTDPIWSVHAGPFGLLGPRRVCPPGQPLAALPGVDLVLVSHCHYDHLDLPTLAALRRRFRPQFVSCLGNARHFAKAAVREVVELDWWQSAQSRGACVTCVPARHFSARTPWDRNRALWGGFVVEAGGFCVYFAGDTAWGDHFAAIGARFPALDLALLPIGACEPRPLMARHHMNAGEAVRAQRQLGARSAIGMHFACFPLADEAPDAPLAALASARAAAGVPAGQFFTLREGETVRLPARPG
jgi:L-ascorbate metabolism protein UlaG (beta-lactamase superfamily)